MKNKKAQAMGIGVILIVFVAVLVGVILFQSAAQAVGTVTNTVSVVNETFDTPANGTAAYLTNYRAISNLIVINASNNVSVPAANYVVTNNVVYNGALAVKIVPDATIGFKSHDWKLTYTGQPLTYVDNAGGRSMVSLITIFFALGVALIALYPVYSSKLLEMIGK